MPADHDDLMGSLRAGGVQGALGQSKGGQQGKQKPKPLENWKKLPKNYQKPDSIFVFLEKLTKLGGGEVRGSFPQKSTVKINQYLAQHIYDNFHTHFQTLIQNLILQSVSIDVSMYILSGYKTDITVVQNPL